MAFGILVWRFYKGELSLPHPTCERRRRPPKNHFDVGKKSRVPWEEACSDSPNQAGTLHPNPAPFPADSGHARCSFPFRNKGGAIMCRELLGKPTTRQEGEWISGDAMQHLFLRFEMARRIRGWCRLVVLMYCLLCRLRQKRGHVHL